MTERLNDDEADALLPLIIELATTIEPKGVVASRLRLAQERGARVRQATRWRPATAVPPPMSADHRIRPCRMGLLREAIP
jgi:hypothetical protein